MAALVPGPEPDVTEGSCPLCAAVLILIVQMINGGSETLRRFPGHAGMLELGCELRARWPQSLPLYGTEA